MGDEEGQTRKSELSAHIPSPIEGILLKKSPNPLRFRKFQSRWVELALGNVTWRNTTGTITKGHVDFSKNACLVTESQTVPSEFTVRPETGEWTDGDFTGVESGRELVFDTRESEYDRTMWVEAMRRHIEYGRLCKGVAERIEKEQQMFGETDLQPKSHKTSLKGKDKATEEHSMDDFEPLALEFVEGGIQRPVLPDSFLIPAGAGAAPAKATAPAAAAAPGGSGQAVPGGRRAHGSRSVGGTAQSAAPAAAPSDGRPRLCPQLLRSEDAGGQYPLKEEWDLRIPKPPRVERRRWRGVFTGASEALVEKLATSACYVPLAAPLESRPGEPSAATAPSGAQYGCLRQCMEFINYYMVLQGRPPCWYGGVGPAPLEMRNGQRTKSGVYPGHFRSIACFATPEGGNGGVADLLRNCWRTQASPNHGGFQWMSMCSGHNGEQFVPYTPPFGLMGVPIPSRSAREDLLADPSFTKGAGHTPKTLAESLYACGHGPFTITYKRPAGHQQEQERDLCFAWNYAQNLSGQVVEGNESPVNVYPPPGMIIKGGFQKEPQCSRKGLPGEEEMAAAAGVASGETLGGPVIKVHLHAIADHGKYKRCEAVKLVDVETKKEVPLWVSDAGAQPNTEYYLEAVHDKMRLSAAKVWAFPKTALTMNRAYECSMRVVMESGPLDLCWSWTTFGPRVYEVKEPSPEDPTRSLDWALESISDMRMKPQLKANRPVPNVVCLGAGEFVVTARSIDPGAWLHIEGAGVESTVLVVEPPTQPETFDFPAVLELPSDAPAQGFEYDWHNPTVPLFVMSEELLRPAQHDGGGMDLGGWKEPPRVVSMSGITLRHSVPLVSGSHGSVELVDCHVIGPSQRDLMAPELCTPSSPKPKIRMLEVSFQPMGLFDYADKNKDGVLDMGEFVEMAQQDLPSMAKEEMEEIFRGCDSGGTGHLTRPDFALAYLALLDLRPNSMHGAAVSSEEESGSEEWQD